MSRVRLACGLLLVAGVAGTIVVLGAPEDESEVDVRLEKVLAGVPAGIRDCAGCHGDIAREAALSMHGQAYADPEVLALSRNFQDESCISCHAPMPLFATGLGKRVHARNENRQTGVDCLSCHLMPDGRVAGKRGVGSAPCRPVKRPELLTAYFCSGCHNQHWTVDEFMASSWSDTHTCNTCHMPKVDRPVADGGPVRKDVATHRFEGGETEWMLQKGVALAAEIVGGEIAIRVTNSGTGHKAPTDSRHRSMNLLVTITDRAGNVLEDHREIAEYRLYYREMKKPTTQLEPHEEREYRVALPEDRSGLATVMLVYCRKPPEKIDRTWTVIHRRDLDF